MILCKSGASWSTASPTSLQKYRIKNIVKVAHKNRKELTIIHNCFHVYSTDQTQGRLQAVEEKPRTFYNNTLRTDQEPNQANRPD